MLCCIISNNVLIVKYIISNDLLLVMDLLVNALLVMWIISYVAISCDGVPELQWKIMFPVTLNEIWATVPREPPFLAS